MTRKIGSSIENWEEKKLGADERYVAVSTIDESGVDDALALKAISIRMPLALIEDLKLIAKLNGLGYQPLIKQVLTRFVESEKKQLLNDAVRRLEIESETKKHHDDVA